MNEGSYIQGWVDDAIGALAEAASYTELGNVDAIESGRIMRSLSALKERGHVRLFPNSESGLRRRILDWLMYAHRLLALSDKGFDVRELLREIQKGFRDDAFEALQAFRQYGPINGWNKSRKNACGFLDTTQTHPAISRAAQLWKENSSQEPPAAANQIATDGTTTSDTGATGQSAGVNTTVAVCDVFVSHATEDKPYVEPLVNALQNAGARVWFDKSSLEWGDDLRSAIDRGLANCRYGIVVFSQAFLRKKKWTEYELNSLFARETAGQKLILPIWHGITRDDLLQYGPGFADRLAKISSSDSYEDIVASLLRLLGRHASTVDAERNPPQNHVATQPEQKPNAIAYAMGFSNLRVKQEGVKYILILTADNESDTPQPLSWDMKFPAALHRSGRIQGNELLRPRDRNCTRILLSKSLAELQSHEAETSMSQPITGTITLGSKKDPVDTTWSKLSKSST